jgi:hypothetical protein
MAAVSFGPLFRVDDDARQEVALSANDKTYLDTPQF